MGKSSPSAPPAPDPYKTAAAQAGANKDAIEASARFNQIGQVSPFGRTYYTGTVGQPDRTQVTELNPQDAQQLERQRAVAAGLGNQAIARLDQIPQNRFTLDGLPQIDQNAANAIRDQVFKNYSGKINEQYDRNAEAQRAQLVNQGINIGNEAYSRASQDLNTSRDQALRDAYSTALIEGRNQITQQQALRNQGIQDRLTERTQPFNELAAFIQGAPAFQGQQAPQAAQYQVAPADIQGARNTAYQGALSNYQSQVGARNAKMGSTAGLAGSLGGAAIIAHSSKAWKQDNQPIDERDILEAFDGIQVEKWKYTIGFNDQAEHIGCYAEDFKKAFGVGDGKHINLVDALGVCMSAIKALKSEISMLKGGAVC